MIYQPGDSFDVYHPNRPVEVEDMLHRLGLQDQRNHRVHVSLLKDTKKRGKVGLSHALIWTQCTFEKIIHGHTCDIPVLQ